MTVAYNCKAHTRTIFAPFKLVFCGPSGPLTLETFPKELLSPHDSKRRWRNWIGKTISTARLKQQTEQQHYNRN